VSPTQELPPLVLAPLLLIGGVPLLTHALRYVALRVPAAAPLRADWRFGDLGAATAAVALVLLLGAALRPAAIVVQLLLGQGGFLAGAMLALALARQRGHSAAVLGLTRPAPARAYALAFVGYGPLLLCYFGVLVAWGHLGRWLGQDEEQEILRRLLEIEGLELALCGVVAVLVGPFLEELFFRGFLQEVLVERLGLGLGLPIAALVFAGLHGLAGLPGLVLLSFYLAWLRQRTGSIFVPFLVHAAHNGLTLFLALALRTSIT
jgi:membrane protease YdiL (CAAX protease family)